MKRFKMLISVLLMIFICMSCTARSIHKKFCYTIEKDSCVYAKIVNDSIAQIISEARTAVCVLKNPNPIDSMRTDSIINIQRKTVLPILQYLFFDPNNFKSNQIVYGNFSSSACITFKASSKKKVHLELDFGLKKWRLLNSHQDIVAIGDMKENNLQFLRFVRLLFPEDITLNLLYNNLNSI